MRSMVFDEKFLDLDAWTHRDTTFEASKQRYARGDESGVSVGSQGLQLRVVPLDLAEDGEQRYGYGYLGALGFEVLPGDIVSAKMLFNHGRGNHASLWLQSHTPYGTPADYEADIEHMGAKNPWRRTGVPLHQAVHWRAEGQPFGQYTSVKTEVNSNDILGPGMPWSDAYRTYSIRVHQHGFSFMVGTTLLNRIRTENVPRPMFICLSNITRDFEHEDLEEAFVQDPTYGPGITYVSRVWVTRP